jgi:hypothetical protein
MLTVAAATDTWPPFTPLADGRPLLNAATAEEAQVAGNHLALLWRGDGSPHLTLFRGPEGAVVCDFPAKNPTTFRLSGDGRLLARTAGKSMCEAEVVATAIGPPVLRAARGKYHPDPGVQTGRGWVAVVVGKLATLFRWVGGPLEVQRLTFSAPAGLTRLMAEVGVGDWPGTAVQKRTASAGEPWDLERVPRLAALPGGRCVLVDVLGQVFLTHAAGKVAALMVWRDQSAGWLPDGTRFGPKPLSGFAETPGAYAHFGEALAAWEAGVSGP